MLRNSMILRRLFDIESWIRGRVRFVGVLGAISIFLVAVSSLFLIVSYGFRKTDFRPQAAGNTTRARSSADAVTLRQPRSAMPIYLVPDTEDFDQLSAKFDKIYSQSGSFQRTSAIAGILRRMGAIDAQAAFKLLERLPKNERLEFENQVLEGMAKTNPKAAWKWALANPMFENRADPMRGKLVRLGIVLSGLAFDSREDSVVVIDLITELERGAVKNQLAAKASGYIAANDFDSAIRWLSAAPKEMRVNMVVNIARTLSDDSAVAAISFAQSLSDKLERFVGISSAFDRLSGRASLSELESLVNSLSNVDERDVAARSVARATASSDVEMAARLLNSIVDSKVKSQATDQALRSLQDRPLETSLKLISSLNLPDVERLDRLARSSSSWFYSNPISAKESIRGFSGLTPDLRETLISRLSDDFLRRKR